MRGKIASRDHEWSVFKIYDDADWNAPIIAAFSTSRYRGYGSLEFQPYHCRMGPASQIILIRICMHAKADSKTFRTAILLTTERTT